MEQTHNKRLLYLAVMTAAFVAFIVAVYLIINQALQRSMEQQAVNVAEIVAIQATSARSVYAREIAKKLKEDGFGPHVDSYKMKGYVPIPAQFLKKIGLESSKNTAELFYYRPVSKWNLDQSQGLNNDFLKWAWPQLEVQDQDEPEAVIAWEPVWRVESNNQGKRFLRYLRADPASAESCVSCHNAYEQSDDVIQLRKRTGIEEGKQWKLHQLLGALYVSIPLNKVETIARQQNRETIMVIIVLSLLAVLLASIFVKRLSSYNGSAAHSRSTAAQDRVTGLLSRRGFEYILNELYDKETEHTGNSHLLCHIELVCGDLDSGSSGPDTHEDILITAANVIKNNTRKGDHVARLGGRRFAILIQDCDIDKGRSCAQHIEADIGRCLFRASGRTVSMSARIGIGEISPRDRSVEEAIYRVEHACTRSVCSTTEHIHCVDEAGQIIAIDGDGDGDDTHGALP